MQIKGKDICYESSCFNQCGDEFGTGYFRIDADVWCSVQCYWAQREKEDNAERERPQRGVHKSKSTSKRHGRVKKSSRKNPRKSKSSKRRV